MRLFNATAGRFGLPFEGTVLAIPLADPISDAVAIIGMNEADLPDQVDGPVEFWRSENLQEQVNQLVARLLGGRVIVDASAHKTKVTPKKQLTAKVGRETAGRHGKGVTTVFDLNLTEDQMKDLAATLKHKCGTGGTVKDKRIEIQGDHRDRIVAELEKLGYKVKRAGG